jgi:methionyl-tRNA synthetase
MKPKFYITTAIFYTSGKPHAGNVYEAILADAIARWKRRAGYDVFFMTGTDEHGQKVQLKAEAEGIPPQRLVDDMAGHIRGLFDRMDISYDHFIRTTDARHRNTVQKIFIQLYNQGDIYKSSYEGLYCTPCESFYTETQAVGNTCPDCGGSVDKAHEDAYFFKLSKYADRLIAHYKANPGFLRPESRVAEMMNNFLLPGLQDLCVSRSSFTWGVPVPVDEGHVIYVWIDALSNYITGLDYDSENPGELYRKYWPADVHVLGKDIVRFHAIYWPIILLALGEPLPEVVLGHPWLLMNGAKLSKSTGNVIYAEDLAKHFGADATRHILLAEMPYAQDTSFTYDQAIARFNTDLANILGNLVSRTHAMTTKYCGGIVPALPGVPAPDTPDHELWVLLHSMEATVAAKMEEFKIADAIEALWALPRRCNKFIDETQPWLLGRDESQKARLDEVLGRLLVCIAKVADLLAPFMPATADRIVKQLGLSKPGDACMAGAPLGEAETLFARMDDKKKLEEITAYLEASAVGRGAPTAPPVPNNPSEIVPDAARDYITIDDFAKVEIRVAKVLACERVEKSDKLLKLTLDTGTERRTVLSGIAQHYQPEALTGRNVLLVANLAPRKMRGMESQGMILCSETGEEDVRVLFADDNAVPGSTVR